MARMYHSIGLPRSYLIQCTQEDYKKNLWISAGSKHTCLSIHIPPVQIAIFHSQNKHFRGCEIGRDRDVMHIA